MVPRLYKIAARLLLKQAMEDTKAAAKATGLMGKSFFGRVKSSVKLFFDLHKDLLKSAGGGMAIGGAVGGAVGVVAELLKALARSAGGLKDDNIKPLLLLGLFKGGLVGAGFGGVAGWSRPTLKKLKSYLLKAKKLLGKIKSYTDIIDSVILNPVVAKTLEAVKKGHDPLLAYANAAAGSAESKF